jgi:hypothetical protein
LSAWQASRWGTITIDDDESSSSLFAFDYDDDLGTDGVEIDSSAFGRCYI